MASLNSNKNVPATVLRVWLRVLIGGNVKARVVLLVSGRFVPMDVSYPDVSYPLSVGSYPTLWSIRTQEIMTQNVLRQTNYGRFANESFRQRLVR